MKEVKAEYIVSKDKATEEEVHVRMIPPEPEGEDLGGISKEKLEQIDKLNEDSEKKDVLVENLALRNGTQKK